MSGSQKTIGIVTVVCCLFAAGCDFARPPKPSRVDAIPESATLEFRPKVGWVWSLCVDAAGGSNLFSWAEYSTTPMIRIRPIACASADEAPDSQHIEITGGPQRVEFLLPARPVDFENDILSGAPCPASITPDLLSQYAATAFEASRSQQLTVEAQAEAREMAFAIEALSIDRLWIGGGMGNGQSWRIRCSDISGIIPETNPSFPEHLKLGAR